MNDSNVMPSVHQLIRNPMDGPIRIGLVGAGAIAGIHRQALEGIRAGDVIIRPL